MVEGKGKSPLGDEQFSLSVKPRPLQYLDVAGTTPEVTGDDRDSLAQVPAETRLLVEFDDTPVLLQTAGIGFVDQEMRVVLDGHGRQVTDGRGELSVNGAT